MPVQPALHCVDMVWGLCGNAMTWLSGNSRWKRVWSGEIEHPLKPARNRFESLLLRFSREFCAPRMGGEPCLFQVR